MDAAGQGRLDGGGQQRVGHRACMDEHGAAIPEDKRAEGVRRSQELSRCGMTEHGQA